MSPPDFIIAGAMRAGTTALAQGLSNHPTVFMTSPKEPSWFAVNRGALDYCGPGDQWFAQQHPVDWESYQALFAGSGGKLTGEASAIYLSVPGVAAEIAARRPDVKIILMLRDPVSRAHSAWHYLRARGRETIKDFRRALDAEDSRRETNYGPMWWYVGASRYQEGLAEFYDAFPRSSILVVTTESLRADAGKTLGTVYDFLGVDEDGAGALTLERDVNASGVPRADWMASALYPSDGLRRVAAKAAPEFVRGWVRRARASAVRPPEPMPPDCRDLLIERLGDVPSAVARLTGTDTAHWLSVQGAAGN